MHDRQDIGKAVPSTTARSGGSASVLWGLAHLPGRVDPPRLLPTLWDGKQERLAWLTERALVRLPLPFRSIHLSFDEAMKALMGVEPQRVGLGNKQAKHKPKSKGKKSHSN